MKIDITDKAREELEKMLQGQEQSNKKVRVVMTGISWRGPKFNVALDEHNDNDTHLKVDGLDFIIDKKLTESIISFIIDYKDSFFWKGFQVNYRSEYSGFC